MKNQILIKNGTIVTMGSQGIVDPGFVLIKGTRIAAIGKMSEIPEDLQAEKVIGGLGCIVLPGLIDAHFHTCQQLERGIFSVINATGRTRYPGWAHFLIPWEAELTEDDVRLSARAAYINAVEVGTTCISEHGGRYPEILAATMEEIGIRGLVAMSTMDMDPTGIGIPANMLFTTQEAIERGRKIVTQWPFTGDGLARGVFSLRQILVCTPELIQETVRLADIFRTMVQQHNNEGHYEVEYAFNHHNRRPAEYLDYIHGLSPRVIAAHSVLMSDREVELFAENKVKVAHCPKGNFAGLGAPKLPLMRRLGVTIGIGSDGAAGGSIDLFEAMRTSLTCQTAFYGAHYDDRNVTSPLEVLKMATINGAKVVGLDKEIGSLEVGKRADLIIVDATDLNVQPSPDLIFSLVNCASGKDVQAVIINGQVVMENRTIVKVDETAIRQEVAKRAPELQTRFLETRI